MSGNPLSVTLVCHGILHFEICAFTVQYYMNRLMQVLPHLHKLWMSRFIWCHFLSTLIMVGLGVTLGF